MVGWLNGKMQFTSIPAFTSLRRARLSSYHSSIHLLISLIHSFPHFTHSVISSFTHSIIHSFHLRDFYLFPLPGHEVTGFLTFLDFQCFTVGTEDDHLHHLSTAVGLYF